MTDPGRSLHLNINVSAAGSHPGAWLIEGEPLDFLDIKYWQNVARLAERGTLDAVFTSDRPALRGNPPKGPFQIYEPTILLTAMAAATEHIGLVGTASTTFNEPYNLVRRFSSLDHASGGRAAWNVVTTYDPSSSGNFGLPELPEHDERYRRADEFMEIAFQLWDSWEDDALVADRESGVFANGERIHEINYVGDFFSVRGPMVATRSPQGRPVIVQAGASEIGRAFAAKWADVLFCSLTTVDQAQEFYAEMRGRAANLGRNPDHLLVLPGLYMVVGSTEKEAWERKETFDSTLDQEAEKRALAIRLRVDPDALDLDKPFPPDLFNPELFDGSRGFLEATLNVARAENLTVRGVLAKQHRGGHRVIVGTPEQIADDLHQWLEIRAADGFNLQADSIPGGLELIVDQVVPELRRRGIFRKEYTGSTLRDHLGLPRPASSYSEQRLTSSGTARA